jgi:hypothetical protein
VTATGPFDRPILALGMPRSGTTWLGKILDSHPETLYRHEPDTWQRIGALPLFAPAEATAETRATVRAFVASLPGMLIGSVCADFSENVCVAAERAAVRISPAVPQVPDGSVFAERTGSAAARRAGRQWLAVKSIESPGRAGVFVTAVPEARIVHIVRHPCGYVARCCAVSSRSDSGTTKRRRISSCTGWRARLRRRVGMA